MNSTVFLLGVDGGGTTCRARLCRPSGEVLAEAAGGPANLRLGLERSFSAVCEAASLCLDRAGLAHSQLPRIVACLALAGASEPTHLAAARCYPHPFGKAIVTTDAHAACLGAHGHNDGGVIIAGTGAIGYAIVNGQSQRVGGWGLPVSDEGSGAWLGAEALRRLLWALDGRIAWTGLLRALADQFANDPHSIVRWTQAASPRDFATLAPRIFEYDSGGDPVAGELLALAAGHIDAMAALLLSGGAVRLALVGGCAPFLRSRLSAATTAHLVEPLGDALTGALSLAGALAQSLAPAA